MDNIMGKFDDKKENIEIYLVDLDSIRFDEVDTCESDLNYSPSYWNQYSD